MKSLDEMKVLNKAYAIFEKFRLESDLFPEMDKEFFIARKENIYDIINEIVALMETEHPLWNFGKHPGN